MACGYVPIPSLAYSPFLLVTESRDSFLGCLFTHCIFLSDAHHPTRVGSLECFSWAIDWPGTIYAIHTSSKRYGIITPVGRKYHDPKRFSTMWLWEVLWCVSYYFHLCLAWSMPKNRATRWKYRWPPTDWHLCDLCFQFHLCMKPDLCPDCLATAINSLFWLS